MGKFHVVYFGSNDVPVDLLKPILAEIDADMTIRRPVTEADVVEMAKDADGIIMHGSVPLSRDTIGKMKRVKVVARTGVGVDRMDLAAAKEHGLIICNAAGCNSIEVSEQAIGLMIAISRKLVRMNQYVHDGKWKRHTASCTPTAAGYIESKAAPWGLSAWAMSANKSRRAPRACA